MNFLTTLVVVVTVTNSLIRIPMIDYIAERLFSTPEGQALLLEMNEANVSINVGENIYGSGSVVVNVIGYDIITGANGEYFYDYHLIRLDEKDFGVRTTKSLMSTLAHEIQHAVDFETGHTCNTEQRAQLRAASVLQKRLVNVDELSSTCVD